MLKHRILTAIILIALIFWGIFSASITVFEIFMAIIVLIAAWEWADLSGIPHKWQWCLYALAVVLLTLLGHVYVTNLAIWIGMVWWFVAFGLLFAYSWEKRKILSHKVMRGLIGILVLVPFWQSVIVMRGMQHNVAFIILFVVLVAAMDTAAYFAGRLWGKHKLAVAISPGKTIEGLCGAVVVNIIVSVIFCAVMSIHGHLLWQLVLVNLVAGLMSVVGDLLESAVKRVRGVKDSGTMLPGHGGVLDRIDGYTAAAPLFVVGLMIIGLIQ